MTGAVNGNWPSVLSRVPRATLRLLLLLLLLHGGGRLSAGNEEEGSRRTTDGAISSPGSLSKGQSKPEPPRGESRRIYGRNNIGRNYLPLTERVPIRVGQTETNTGHAKKTTTKENENTDAKHHKVSPTSTLHTSTRTYQTLFDAYDLFQILVRHIQYPPIESRKLTKIATKLRGQFGEHSTIWGLKQKRRSRIVTPTECPRTATAATPSLPLSKVNSTKTAPLDAPLPEWELYWALDGDIEGPAILPSHVEHALSPWLDLASAGCDLHMLDDLVRQGVVTMFSVDIDLQALRSRRLRKINVYVEEETCAEEARFETRSYACDADGFTRKNRYVSYPTRRIDRILERFETSVNYPDKLHDEYVACVLGRPELYRGEPREGHVQFIDYATKLVENDDGGRLPQAFSSTAVRDGLYFAGIGIEQLLAFLRTGPAGDCVRRDAHGTPPASATWDWPPEILDALQNARLGLSALRFDVGFDFQVVAGKTGGGCGGGDAQSIRFHKSGFYGSF